jgi:hypothetical protein
MNPFERTYTCIYESLGRTMAARVNGPAGRTEALQVAKAQLGLLSGAGRVIALVPGDFAERAYVYQSEDETQEPA